MSASIYSPGAERMAMALNADTVMMVLNVTGIGLSIVSTMVEYRYRREYAARALLAAQMLEQLYGENGTAD
jgi:hypothetical protein